MGSYDLIEVQQTRFVIFADILGFASLVINCPPLDEESFADTKVGRVYTQFHRLLQEVVDEARRDTAGRTITVIGFSDSAFIACGHSDDALDIAAELMRRLIRARIPCRMGIAQGGFRVVKYQQELSTHTAVHSAHFTGTAVVQAHYAENVGYKGMRIIVGGVLGFHLRHSSRPSVLPPHLPDLPEYNHLQELNYLTGTDEDDHLCTAVMEMSSSAESHVRRHYDDTLSAMERMRSALGSSA